MKVVADDKIPYLKGILEPFVDVEYYPGSDITKDKIIDADALLIRTRTICNKELLEGTPVSFIATATIGFDHIDTEYCEKNNIFWTNSPGCNSGSVQQYIASVLVNIAEQKGFDLTKKTLGVVGVGNVGKKVVRLAEHLGMYVVQNDPPRMRREGPCGFISLEGILREADIITFHVPLTIEGEDKTYHLVNDALIQKMNSGTILINSSRGEVVSTEAIKNGLKSEKLGGAVLDVWENEPNIDLQLLDMVDIATPHIAGYSADGKANGTAMVVQALSKHFGLELYDWVPDNVQIPQNADLNSFTSSDEQEFWYHLINSTYQVLDDNDRLRKNPTDFEKLRGNYPLRREFSAYSINATGDKELDYRLQKLGFILKTKN